MWIATFFGSSSFRARLSRLCVGLPVVAAIDQLFLRFGIDLKGPFGGSLWLFLSVFLNILLLTELIFFPRRVTVGPAAEQLRQPEGFVPALLRFASSLGAQGKVSTLLEIRDSMSHLLHLLGEHAARFSLGEVALSAAIQEADELRRAQILIDDLGWAAYMSDRRRVGEENIRKGIAIAQAIDATDERRFVRSRIIVAKGYRHLAMMAADDVAASSPLKAARDALKSVEGLAIVASAFVGEMQRDNAQIDHATATLILRGLGIEKNGALPAGNQAASAKAQEALRLAGKAAAEFEAIEDYERLTKTLATKERVLSALGDETAAIETHAQRDAVARSHSVRI